jgi:hypothetical protein
MDQLLRRPRFDTSPDGEHLYTSAAPDQAYAAPPTAVLTPPAQTVAAAPASAALPSAPVRGSRRAWVWMTGVLLLVVLPGALLAYYFLRPSASATADNTPPVVNSNQTTEPLNNGAADETGVGAVEPQPTETLQPQPKPSASVEPSPRPSARQERVTEAPVLSSTPAPLPTATPIAQATPLPQPSPATSPLASSNNGKTTAQDNTDAFFFQAVNLVNGREPRALQRAELVRALQLFLNVRSGPHHAEASKQSERLGKELDRRRRQSQP